jgi:hypothetical protein
VWMVNGGQLVLSRPLGASQLGELIQQEHYRPGLIQDLTNTGIVVGESSEGNVILIPINIIIRKKDNSPPRDGMLAMVGDSLVYNITDDPIGSPIPVSTITWEYRRLKGDGTYGVWTSFVSGSGPRVEVTENGAGIFQIRIRAVVDGLSVYFNYSRTRDDPHGSDSSGNINPILKEGQPDYVGIAAGPSQYALALAAKASLGSTTWAQSATTPVSATFTASPGEPKCNIFVYHMAVASGASVPLDSGGSPPRAYNWWDQSFAIAGWVWNDEGWWVEPGVVVARPSSNWWILQDILARGHVGILDYDGAWINAGPAHVNRFPHITDTEYQTAHFRNN